MPFFSSSSLRFNNEIQSIKKRATNTAASPAHLRLGLNTSNRGAACTKESDCGTVCGNGRKEGSEQCDGGGYAGGGCPVGQFCAPPGSANQCTCQTPVCGNGIREGTEECDGPGTCGPNEICNAQCQCVVM